MTSARPFPDLPPAPQVDTFETWAYVQDFGRLVDALAAHADADVDKLLTRYFDAEGDPDAANERCLCVAAVGPLVTAKAMGKPCASASPTWDRITAKPSAASRTERAAVRIIAAHRAGNDPAAAEAHLKLLVTDGIPGLAAMLTTTLRICAEVKRP